ncbi:MAG TPA: hypothetical protein VKY27_06330 [Bacteriovoracaceae bacterium]|nr:hypothetical protein [Bacteriovoracaceae bacterium]
MRRYLIHLLMIGSLIACGQQSEISDAIPAQRTSEAYGDGRHTVMPMVLPLSDDTIESFDSPFSKVGFVLGGFSKLFADLGAMIGMGKMHISLTQKIPEIPQEYIEDVRFKRVFLYIEPVKGPRETSFLDRLFFGRDNVDFKFINRLAVKFSTAKVSANSDWSPIVESNTVKSKESLLIDKIFEEEKTHAGIIDIRSAKELVLLTFDKKKKERYLKSDKHGPIYIINTSSPAQTRKYLRDHPKLEGIIERTHILNKSILVEIKNNHILEEYFKAILGEEGKHLESLGVEYIESCKPHTCFDFNVSELNLLPILLKGNAIKIDAFIEAGKVPESFQLKGFIEADIRMNLTF